MTRKAPSAVTARLRAAAVPSVPVPEDRSQVVTAPPAERPAQPKAPEWPARISMTASREMKRELESARLDDGIEVTARLRAMIRLWQQDPELRARVDELARDLR